MTLNFSFNDAYRVINNVIDERIRSLTKSGAGIEYTWGTVSSLDAGGTVSVYLYGDVGDSGGFKLENGLMPDVGDPVRVAIDRRGSRWIEAIIPDRSTAFSRMEIDVRDGVIRTGDGTTVPTALAKESHSHDADYSDIAHTHATDPPFNIAPYYGTANVSHHSLSVANRCIYIPVYVPSEVTIDGARFVVGTAAGNISVAIYNDDLSVRMQTTGSIACPSAGRADVTLTSTILTQGRYWIGFSASSTSALFGMIANTSTQVQIGNQYQETAHPAPTNPAVAGETNISPAIVLTMSGGYP